MVGWRALHLGFSLFQGDGAAKDLFHPGRGALHGGAQGSKCGELNGRNKGIVPRQLVPASRSHPAWATAQFPSIHRPTGVGWGGNPGCGPPSCVVQVGSAPAGTPPRERCRREAQRPTGGEAPGAAPRPWKGGPWPLYPCPHCSWGRCRALGEGTLSLSVHPGYCHCLQAQVHPKHGPPRQHADPLGSKVCGVAAGCRVSWARGCL